MTSFWDNLRRRYLQGNIAVKLIYVNVAVFLLQALFLTFCRLLGLNAGLWLLWLELPAQWSDFIVRPWSLLTYMFMHGSLMHLFFNMLWLYVFGRYFLQKFDTRQFLTVYLAGGLTGGIFYMVGYNVFPYYAPYLSTALLSGASAAILAITLTVAVYRPEEELMLMFLGRLKMKWLAVIMIVIDLLSLTGGNGGGSLAHLGGAVLGILAGLYLKSRWQGRLHIDRKRSTGRQARTRKYHRSTEERTVDIDQAYRDRRRREEDRRDAILDKIKASGYDSLTAEEKKYLFDSGK